MRRQTHSARCLRAALRPTLWGSLLVAAAYSVPARAQVDKLTASTSVYVRQDSDDTSVVAPRLHLGAPVGDATRLDLVYTVDVWTSASVDIVASASKPVTEQRDEINAAVSQEFEDLAFTSNYRYSREPDYDSHGLTIGSSIAFADKNTTLDLRLGGSLDQVGRAGDPTFHKPVRNVSAKLGLTQVLSTHTFAQVIYELMNAHGYNSSPYRWIGFGSVNGLCNDPSLYTCQIETNPNDRVRHAVFALARHAFGDSFAIGVDYRFYLDSWGVMSHTAQAELSWTVSSGTMLGFRYRFYTQGDADQYQPAYDVTDLSLTHFSNDKELSAFTGHKVAIDFEQDFELDAQGHILTLVLSAAPSVSLYSNYRPLDQIQAFEFTLTTVFKL